MSGHQNKRNREPAVYTVPELAARWKVSKMHVLNAIEAGQIGAVDVGNGTAHFYRIPVAEVEKYEAARNTKFHVERPSRTERSRPCNS